MCENIAVETGSQIAASATQLGLRISAKSKELFSRPGVAQEVARRLQAGGVQVSATTLTKELGIGTAACSRMRNVSVLRERRVCVCVAKRLREMKVLARQDRRCRKLICTGATSQGTWGHQPV